jgi:hypothetical protein
LEGGRGSTKDGSEVVELDRVEDLARWFISAGEAGGGRTKGVSEIRRGGWSKELVGGRKGQVRRTYFGLGDLGVITVSKIRWLLEIVSVTLGSEVSLGSAAGSHGKEKVFLCDKKISGLRLWSVAKF